MKVEGTKPSRESYIDRKSSAKSDLHGQEDDGTKVEWWSWEELKSCWMVIDACIAGILCVHIPNLRVHMEGQGIHSFLFPFDRSYKVV